MNHSEEDISPNQSVKSMLDLNKERKLIKVDFSALAHLVVSLYAVLSFLLFFYLFVHFPHIIGFAEF